MEFALGEAERRLWNEEGFFVREDAFDPGECRALGERAAALALGELPFPPEHRERNAQVDAGEEDADGLAAMHKIHHPHLYDRAFRERQCDARVVDPVSGLLGADVLGINSLFIFKPPRRGMGFPWHQDQWYFRRRYTTATTVGTWQAIDPATRANGCLWVVPGSHRDEVREHRQPEGPQQSEYKRAVGVDDDAGVPIELPPGAVLFFHSRLLHRSLPNGSTDAWRRCYVAHYLSARATPTEHVDEGQPVIHVRGSTFEGCVRPHVHDLLPI